MTSITTIIIWLVICILYGWASTMGRKQDTIFIVSTEEDYYFSSITSPSKVIKLSNGRYTNTRNYIRIRVYGNGLVYRGICDGEEWLVQPLKDYKTLMKKDIILLYVKDSYILREFKGWKTSNDLLETLKYENSGHTKVEYYRVNQVKGIVRFSI